MSKWLGYAVSVRCGSPLGCYQGTVAAADGSTLTLTKAFRNGFPYPKPQVTLNAADIKSLSIISAVESPTESSQPPPSRGDPPTASRGGRKQRQRATVCESLQASHTEGGGHGARGDARYSGNNNKGNNNNGGNNNNKVNNNNNKGKKSTGIPSEDLSLGLRRGPLSGSGGRDEAAFGPAASVPPMEEFDFETNNALFDKRALYRSMGQRPDLIPNQHAYRHDQNVLGPAGARESLAPCIVVPLAESGPQEYVTDGGLRMPSVTAPLRQRLWGLMDQHQLTYGALTLMSRATCDVLVRLSGGNRRLEPQNKHQAPRAAVLLQPTRAGLSALITARLLQSHGMVVSVYMESPPPAVPTPHAWDAELRALRLTGVSLHTDCNRLGAADVVLLAVDGAPQSAGTAWAARQRCAVVTVEPPAQGHTGVTARATLQALLPLALSGSLGQLYLVDVAPPAPLLASEGVVYHSPFGASAVLALHPADDG